MSTTEDAFAEPTGHENIGRITFIAASAAMGGFLFGYDSSVINGAVTGIQKHFAVGTAATSLTVSAALLGSAVGAAIAGALADRIGRKKVMYIAAVLFAISAVGSALPFAIWDLAIWRVVGGIAIGIASMISPAYIAEVAPAAYRGRLASFQQAAIVLGIFVSQLVNYFIAQGAGGKSEGDLGPLQAWQWMLGVMVLPAVVYFVLAVGIPESPRWLVKHGRDEQARHILEQLEGPGADAHLREIEHALSTSTKVRAKDLMGRFGFLPIVWIGIALSMLQQFVGINVIFYYSSLLWQSVGINQSDSLLISLSTSFVNIIGTVIAMLLVDRVGRKPLAIAGSIGMAISLGIIAWSFSYSTGTGTNVHIPDLQGTMALVFAHVYTLCFAFSWGVVVWVLLGEMFPVRIRTGAMAIATAAQWIANWIVTVTFPTMRDWNLSATYVIYACMAVLSLIFGAKFLKETKGKTLESM
nr:sugar porter family MFS transporter [Mangrovactinospora gilvigrisea]